MSISTVVVDARGGSGRSLATSLSASDDVTVASADDAASALLQAERVAAQVVVVVAPFDGSLMTVCRSLHDLDPQPRILLLDGDADEEMLLQSIEAGVDGYAHAADDVTDAIRRIAGGEAVIPPAMLGALLRRLIQRRRDEEGVADRLVGLTPREREVLSLLVSGQDHHDIATTLFISPETARTHVQRILRKLDVHSRTEAVQLVSRTGLVDRLERLVNRTAS